MALARNLAIFCIIAAANAHEGYPRNYPERQLNYDQNNGYENSWKPENDWPGEEIPGVAGRDYPTFHEVPQTRFQCERQQHPGYYADTEASCQAFHICQPAGRKDSFLCPNGTLFNQEKLVCEWWNNVDCSRAESFYSVNEAIARAMEEATRRASERQNNGYQYGLPKFQNGQKEAVRQPESHYGVPNDVNRGQNSAFRGPIGGHSSNPSPALPVYGLPELSAPAPPTGNGQYDNSYGSAGKYDITGASFGKQQNSPREPASSYLPA